MPQSHNRHDLRVRVVCLSEPQSHSRYDHTCLLHSRYVWSVSRQTMSYIRGVSWLSCHTYEACHVCERQTWHMSYILCVSCLSLWGLSYIHLFVCLSECTSLRETCTHVCMTCLRETDHTCTYVSMCMSLSMTRRHVYYDRPCLLCMTTRHVWSVSLRLHMGWLRLVGSLKW